MSANYIEVKNFTKVIDKRTVLDKVSVQIEKNSIVGFVGKNGSGKTMLFRAISGLIKPTDGEIMIDGKLLGKDISFPPSLGIMIENVGLWSYMTGFEALRLLASINNKISDKEIENAISRVGLEPKDKKKFGKYSLGMKQRLVIAQAIMESPDLLILDEPTNALDADGVTLIHELLLEERAKGATILIASHSSEDIARLCEKTYYMHEGRIKAES